VYIYSCNNIKFKKNEEVCIIKYYLEDALKIKMCYNQYRLNTDYLSKKNISENLSENVRKHFLGIFSYIQRLFHGNSETFSDFSKNYFQASESPKISLKIGNSKISVRLCEMTELFVRKNSPR